MVRREPTAEASFAAIRDRSKFGMAIAAMIRMIATTISNSIREKPFCFFMMLDLLEKFSVVQSTPDNGACRWPNQMPGSGLLPVIYMNENKLLNKNHSQ